MNTDLKALELLFQRPLEPVFTTRDNGKTVFDLPDSFYTDRYRNNSVEVATRFSQNVETRIPLRELTSVPNLDFAAKLGRKDQFSLFNTRHREIAGKLIQLYLDAPNLQQFVALAAYTKDRVNPVMFQYSYAVAVAHRPDSRTVPIPNISQIFPGNFIEPSAFLDARQESSVISKSGNRPVLEIPINYTASNREEEQRLAYFREDIGVNSHHWHWHLVYPASGPMEVVNKDRRGELFYYMHHQLIARYNVERICNNLKRVAPLSNLRDEVIEGYFPKILSSVNNRTYPARASNQLLRDVDRPDGNIEISELERWRDRVLAAIDQGFVENTQGQRIPLDEQRGIDILGNMIEAAPALSVNSQFYGNLHNQGHTIISFSHDPDFRHLEDFGVMGDVTTAMRDPIFYRWHGFIDTIFNKHKTLLPPYNNAQLEFPGINVTRVEAKLGAANARPNVLLTYWQKSVTNLAAGLDFGPVEDDNVSASFRHLQNAPFTYTFNVTNTGDRRTGTCRIFICPKTDERNDPLRLEEQRLMAIEMDKFTVNLVPGENTIRRQSTDSSVAIPFERSFRAVGANYQPTAADELARFRFCGCGWPQHLLLPKGKPEGMQFDLFVMISDYSNDSVEQLSNAPDDACSTAYSFCGLKDKLYPDRRTMGYPFDRRLPNADLTELVGAFTNMAKTDLTIKFNDRTVG
ncbi:phenoloxidase 2 [Drosophila grimshawi]|uniref:GH21740 n=1 Tax=Drosophila grimshawi TaxID=7222 RepID=B4J6I1_DROGR|nr:phenoloxidase 2 [Drosophila grimshawi]EDW01982.1 GH21740 [Drosophila grimshawi]